MGTSPDRPHVAPQVGQGRPASRGADDSRGAPADPRGAAVLAHLAGGAAFVVDHDLRYLVAEGDALRVAGLTPADLIGRCVHDVLDPMLAARIETHCRLALAGQTCAYEHDAHGRAYLSRAMPLHDGAGGIYAALVVSYDITDRREAEARRRRSEETFTSLVEHAPFGVYVVDADFRLHTVNDGAAPTFRGIEPLIGRDFGEVLRTLWPEPFVGEALGRFRHTLATGEPYVAPSLTETRQDSERVESYDWQIQRITLPDGTFGVVCYFYNLTAIRATEAKLRDSEARLKLALDASEMGSFIWHVADGRGEPDARTLELFGLSDPGVSIADAVRAVVPAEDWARFAASSARAIDPASTGQLREDIRVLRADGTTRWLSITARTAFEGEPRRGVRLAGLVSDITDRKRSEEALREREERLRDADRRKDEFLAVLAHELRNPLAPIRAGLELIRLGGDDAAAIARVRAMMERQVGHMVRLIDDLLDVSRITSGKITLQRQPSPLQLLVATAVEANRSALTAAGLALDIALPDEPLLVDVDATRAVQIVSNVLHNAVKFTDAGGRIGITAAREARDGEGEVLTLTITDSGVGITADMLPRVFDLFSQGGQSSHAGLGIGLALARRLVELHGGTIAAHSDGPGRGSVFTIRLPVATDVVALAPGEGTPTASSRRRVVVIDDNADAATAMAMLVSALGGDVRVANDGERGLAEVMACRPDLVLLDLGMPGIDGFETCRRIRAALGDACIVVAVSGWGQVQDKQAAARAGFDRHLTKPADPAVLARLLAEAPAAARDGDGDPPRA